MNLKLNISIFIWFWFWLALSLLRTNLGQDQFRTSQVERVGKNSDCCDTLSTPESGERNCKIQEMVVLLSRFASSCITSRQLIFQTVQRGCSKRWKVALLSERGRFCSSSSSSEPPSRREKLKKAVTQYGDYLVFRLHHLMEVEIS